MDKRINKSYYAIIPAEVRYDKNLIPSAKLLYGEITALCNEKGYCWASNDYFANLYSVSKTSVKKWLKSLENNGYIKRSVSYKEGGQEIDTRWITIVTEPRQEKLPPPRQEKGPDNNTLFNNIINNTENKNIKEQKPSIKELTERFNILWKLYPNKKGKEKAFKFYQKAIKEGANDDEIREGIENYTKEINFKRTNKQYIAHGSTWFNNRRWKDEYEFGTTSNTQNKIASNSGVEF
ncbi:helix-turn-helix domain-containing protein [Enterococcus sp. LJL99]